MPFEEELYKSLVFHSLQNSEGYKQRTIWLDIFLNTQWFCTYFEHICELLNKQETRWTIVAVCWCFCWSWRWKCCCESNKWTSPCLEFDFYKDFSVFISYVSLGAFWLPTKHVFFQNCVKFEYYLLQYLFIFNTLNKGGSYI